MSHARHIARTCTRAVRRCPAAPARSELRVHSTGRPPARSRCRIRPFGHVQHAARHKQDGQMGHMMPHPAIDAIALAWRGGAAHRCSRRKVVVTSRLVTYSDMCVRRHLHLHSRKEESVETSATQPADAKWLRGARVRKGRSGTPVRFTANGSTSDVAQVMAMHHVGSLPCVKLTGPAEARRPPSSHSTDRGAAGEVTASSAVVVRVVRWRWRGCAASCSCAGSILQALESID